MNFLTLVLRSLIFYWRSHLGVLMGAAVGTAVLSGALMVGDSVDQTLHSIALNRLGQVGHALASGDRFFRIQLADELSEEIGTPIAPVLQIKGTAIKPSSGIPANQVNVFGVDDRFWEMGNTPFDVSLKNNEIAVNQSLAKKLEIKTGDEIVLRVEKPSLLPRDAPLSTVEDSSIAIRLNVVIIASNEQMGRFSLRAEQIAPYNAFLSINTLNQEIEMDQNANLLLVKNDPSVNQSILEKALTQRWTLADAALELRELENQPYFELRTKRIFLASAITQAASKAGPGALGVLTYLVNSISTGENMTPYSMVTALGPLDSRNASSTPSFMKNGLKQDEIIVNQWLADDLKVTIGDTTNISYYVVGPMRSLIEKSHTFTVRKIVDLDGAAADPTFMPPFPGIEESENCREWDPGFTIDLDKIREKDEAYWDDFRGTPKAFISLSTGQALWENRFGDLTSIRYPKQSHDLVSLKENIHQAIDPQTIGLLFLPVREEAIKASEEGIDFGPLFIGLSFFLIVAALLLMGLLFRFGVEQRQEETGILTAVGFKAAQIRRLYLYEGVLLSTIGGCIGIGLGFLYTKSLLYGLSSVWSGAVANTSIQFHVNGSTLIYGLISGIIICVLTIWYILRRQERYSVNELLSQTGGSELNLTSVQSIKSTKAKLTAFISGGIALLLLIYSLLVMQEQNAGMFFGIGSLLLICGISFSHFLIAKIYNQSEQIKLSIPTLGLRNCARRRGRSLATISLLACGSFLVIAVGANRRSAIEDAHQRSSGTGGFAFYGETTLPLLHDLNTEKGCQAFGLSRDDLEGVKVVPLRVKEGDDASCLNLNRAQRPRLLGVDPTMLEQRNAFRIVQSLGNKSDWSILNDKTEDDILPAIADQATIKWALGKSIGDTLTYKDENGKQFQVQLVGALGGSILQGTVIISEQAFIKRYPSISGYRAMLVDAPSANQKAISKLLTAALQDIGLELTSTVDRLNAFNKVENTYLTLFQALGGLGLILGSIGLGIVVMRNVLERRNELAILRALGFMTGTIRQLVMLEHWILLVFGLACGCIAGFIAVLPALMSVGAPIPYTLIISTIVIMIASGVLWIVLAANAALRGPILNALRNE